MKEIDNLTGPEKSVLLAQAMGWPIEQGLKVFGHVAWIIPPEGDMFLDFYKPRHIALAFRTFYWFYHDTRLSILLRDQWNIDNLMGNPVDKIVPILLDDILSLVIEAGLVELEEETK